MAGKSSWDQANRRQKLGLVWRIRKKISQIIKDYFYLPFFLLIILCQSGIHELGYEFTVIDDSIVSMELSLKMDLAFDDVYVVK
jgi:hypothetical protein